MTPKELMALAVQAREASYSPYSGFAVGAAILGPDGQVALGSNVENASYGLTVCAERVALMRALQRGHREFKAIAIAAPGESPAMPCGACRQVLAEFCDDAFEIYTAGREGHGPIQHHTLGALLPRAFRLEPEI